MLIEDGKLNVDNLREFFPKLDWIRVPRELSERHKDYFYIGTYEDNTTKVKASVRPTRFMQLSESFKNKDQNGKDLPENHRGPSYEFGSTVEVKVPEKFINYLKENSSDKIVEQVQEIEW